MLNQKRIRVHSSLRRSFFSPANRRNPRDPVIHPHNPHKHNQASLERCDNLGPVENSAGAWLARKTIHMKMYGKTVVDTNFRTTMVDTSERLQLELNPRFANASFRAAWF